MRLQQSALEALRAGSAAQQISHRARAAPTRRLRVLSGDWRGTAFWNFGSDVRCAAADQVVIEPQVPDYWPQTPQLSNTDTLALSRFAYMRRRGSDLVLESPRSGALFRICDPKLRLRSPCWLLRNRSKNSATDTVQPRDASRLVG